MDRRTRKSFLMRSRQKEYKDRVKHAKEIIHDCFEKFDKPYLAFSGGKDSVAMLHLVLEEYPDIPVWNWSHGSYLMPESMQKEIESNALRQGVKSENFFVCESKQLESPDARWDYMRWYRGFFGNLRRMIPEQGWDCAMIGIRKEESTARKYRAMKPFNYTVDKFCPQCYPVHEFTWEDVWACIVSNDLPYLSHYEKYSVFAGWERSRLCTFFDDEFQHKNGVDGILMHDFRNR